MPTIYRTPPAHQNPVQQGNNSDTYYAIVSCRSPVHAEGTFFRVLKLVSVGDRAAWGWLGFASYRNKRALHDLVGSVAYKSLRRVASASVWLPPREVKEGWERAEARLRRAQLRVA